VALETLLIGVHLTLSKAFNAAEFELTKVEAKTLADSYSAMERHYPLLQQSEKWRDTSCFIGVVLSVYGLKFKERGDRLRRERAARQPAPIFPGPIPAPPPQTPPGASPGPAMAAPLRPAQGARPAGVIIPGVGPAVNVH